MGEMGNVDKIFVGKPEGRTWRTYAYVEG